MLDLAHSLMITSILHPTRTSLLDIMKSMTIFPFHCYFYSLWGNDITDEAVDSLVELLKTHKNLKELE